MVIILISLMLVTLIVLACISINKEEYEMTYQCENLFITNHFNAKENYTLIDLSNYEKENKIHLNYFFKREAGAGEQHGLTRLVGRAAVFKLKGEDIWIWRAL